MNSLVSYINNEIKPIKHNASIAEVQDIFMDFPYSHFPVTEEGIYIGCVSKETVEFLNSDADIDINDKHEEYRWQEYRCFSTLSSLPNITENKGLRFKDIVLPNELTDFFKKIQQVEELKVTQVKVQIMVLLPQFYFLGLCLIPLLKLKSQCILLLG